MDKIKIICTKEQAVHFVKSTCPSKFNDEWCDYTKDLCNIKCIDCWKNYVVFEDMQRTEITDESL